MTKTGNKTKKKTGKCIEIKTKKYQTRKSPPFYAGDCPGQTKKGKDGTYVSRRDITNIYRWIKVSSAKKSISKSKFVKARPAQTHKTIKQTIKQIPVDKSKGPLYEIHDNGGRPFLVQVFKSGSKVAVYKQGSYGENLDKSAPTKLLLTIPYQKIFIGENNNKSQFGIGKAKGNTILLQLSQGKYQIIGNMGSIQTFSTPDSDIITKYYSPIGNSDIPYPFAIGNKYTYLLVENKYIPNELLDYSHLKMNALYPYDHYYGFMSEEGLQSIKNQSKDLCLKTVVKQQY